MASDIVNLSDSGAVSFSHFGVDGEASGAAVVRPPQPAPLPAIPGFELLEEIGRGGMGVVYKARQVAHDRIVALKMISAGHHASEEELGRFHDEAEAIARLRHPHIVQIFEVGQVDGRYYFALEFVDGGTLADKIAGRPTPARSAAQLLEALARAMHYAHARGIIHRDLKPANVLLHSRRAFQDLSEQGPHSGEWDFRRAMPKITDFGLAKLIDRSGTGRTPIGDVVGTPSYMAPEHALGRPNSSGPTTDVYSLGAILYELLTGRPPFLGATAMDTLLSVQAREPTRPRKLVRSIPSGLETICLKCLRKDPTHRYQSADDLAEDLRLFIEGQPVQAREPDWPQRAWSAFRGKSVSLPMTVLATLTALAAGAALALLFRGQ
jgi:serine/threonine protein kinase